jgi:cytochrome P450
VRHLSFAGGIHTCPGAHLTRLEVEIALKTLIERLPDIALTELPKFKEGTVSRKLAALVVA